MISSAAAGALAANRFGLGARPGDVARIGSDARGWLTAQLTGDTAFTASGLQSASQIIGDALKVRPKVAPLYKPIYVAEVDARMRQAIASEQPFLERLTHFWTNHFAVSVDKVSVLGIAGAFEREAIRPHVLGRFEELLLAVERHPAMLIYLDNHLSIGPHSQRARRVSKRKPDGKAGINENLAREILELHTLGVDGGYSQADVTAFAEALTGWSVTGERGLRKDLPPGQYIFQDNFHEPGAKSVLGRRYAEGGEREAVSILKALAASPTTARYLATKLARHFIADDPPATAVERIAKAYLDSSGDLRSTYRALLESHEAWQPVPAKFKTPLDYVISGFRALQLPFEGNHKAGNSVDVLGQRTYAPGSPAGWPDRSADWDGASALLRRIKWADAVGQRVGSRRNARDLGGDVLGESLSDATQQTIARAASGAQALTLLLASPEFLRR